MKPKLSAAIILLSAALLMLLKHTLDIKRERPDKTGTNHDTSIISELNPSKEFVRRIKEIGSNTSIRTGRDYFSPKQMADINYRARILRHIAISQFRDSEAARSEQGRAIISLIERNGLKPSSSSEAYTGSYYSNLISTNIASMEASNGYEAGSLRRLRNSIQFETRSRLEYLNGPIDDAFFEELFRVKPSIPLRPKNWSISEGDPLLATTTEPPAQLGSFTPKETATAEELGIKRVPGLNDAVVAPFDETRFESDPRYYEKVRQYQLSYRNEFSKSHAGWLETAQLLRDYGIPEYALEHLTPIAYGDTRMIADQLNNAGRFTQTAENLSAILNSKGVEPGDQIGGLHVFFDQLASASDELYRKRFEIESGITDPEFYQKLRSIPIDFSSGPASLKHIMDREFTGGDWFPYTEE